MVAESLQFEGGRGQFVSGGLRGGQASWREKRGVQPGAPVQSEAILVFKVAFYSGQAFEMCELMPRPKQN